MSFEPLFSALPIRLCGLVPEQWRRFPKDLDEVSSRIRKPKLHVVLEAIY